MTGLKKFEKDAVSGHLLTSQSNRWHEKTSSRFTASYLLQHINYVQFTAPVTILTSYFSPLFCVYLSLKGANTLTETAHLHLYNECN